MLAWAGIIMNLIPYLRIPAITLRNNLGQIMSGITHFCLCFPLYFLDVSYSCGSMKPRFLVVLIIWSCTIPCSFSIFALCIVICILSNVQHCDLLFFCKRIAYTLLNTFQDFYNFYILQLLYWTPHFTMFLLVKKKQTYKQTNNKEKQK